MIYNVNEIYNLKVNAIKSRIFDRVEQINQSCNGGFKMYLDKVVSAGLKSNAEGIKTLESTNTARVKPPEKTDYDAIISFKANEYSVDENLIKAVIKAESGFNSNAVSGAGAVGLMQLMPATARALNVTDSYDPVQNIDGGVKYLKSQINRFGGNVKLALAAYNCGPNRVKSLDISDIDDPAQFTKLPKETQNYINTIYGFMYE